MGCDDGCRRVDALGGDRPRYGTSFQYHMWMIFWVFSRTSDDRVILCNLTDSDLPQQPHLQYFMIQQDFEPVFCIVVDAATGTNAGRGLVDESRGPRGLFCLGTISSTRNSSNATE